MSSSAPPRNSTPCGITVAANSPAALEDRDHVLDEHQVGLLAAIGRPAPLEPFRVLHAVAGVVQGAPPAEARLIVQVRIVISKCYTRRFKRSRFSRAFFSSRSLAHLTMMANRKKNETIKKIGLVTNSSSK